MIELEQFDKSIESFARLGVRVVAISNDQAEKAREVQARFPSLRVVSDPDWKILEPLGFVDAGRARDGGDAVTPAVVLVAPGGVVKWVRVATSYVERPGLDEVIREIKARL